MQQDVIEELRQPESKASNRGSHTDITVRTNKTVTEAGHANVVHYLLVDHRWAEVRRLWQEKQATPFPDCRGEEIDGVDLVLVDADLAGCVMHYLGNQFRDDAFQLVILRQIAADLDRIVPQMSGEAGRYFEREARLAHATLGALAK